VRALGDSAEEQPAAGLFDEPFGPVDVRTGSLRALKGERGPEERDQSRPQPGGGQGGTRVSVGEDRVAVHSGKSCFADRTNESDAVKPVAQSPVLREDVFKE
jgi:hypothetical protein